METAHSTELRWGLRGGAFLSPEGTLTARSGSGSPSPGSWAHPRCALGPSLCIPGSAVPVPAEALGSLAWWLGARQVLLLPPTRCVLSQVLHPRCLSVLPCRGVAAPQMVAVGQTDICQVLGQGRPIPCVEETRER